MRVLIDERAVRAFKRYLTTVGHECLTVQEVGWTGKQNGELLSLAEASFDRRLTLDTNLSCQQNLTGRKIAIVVLHSSSNRLDHPTSTLSRLHHSHRESQSGRDRSSRQFHLSLLSTWNSRKSREMKVCGRHQADFYCTM
jgi:hypothetical protein